MSDLTAENIFELFGVSRSSEFIITTAGWQFERIDNFLHDDFIEWAKAIEGRCIIDECGDYSGDIMDKYKLGDWKK